MMERKELSDKVMALGKRIFELAKVPLINPIKASELKTKHCIALQVLAREYNLNFNTANILRYTARIYGVSPEGVPTKTDLAEYETRAWFAITDILPAQSKAKPDYQPV